MQTPLSIYAVVLNSADNVAVAKKYIPKGLTLTNNNTNILACNDIPIGHRFALMDLPKGTTLLQYGQPFAYLTKQIQTGQLVTQTLFTDCLHDEVKISKSHSTPKPTYSGQIPTFNGYIRPDGKVGTRNYIVILPMSMCQNQLAQNLAHEFSSENSNGIDGVVTIHNNGGCGTGKNGIELVRNIINSYMRHPNVAGALLLENGCEHLCLDAFLSTNREPQLHSNSRYLSFQGNSCSVEATMQEGRKLIGEIIRSGAQDRKNAPISKLVLGTKCGGSDGLSGVTANPALGMVSDKVVNYRGGVLLTEVPEMFGAEHLLAKRAKDHVTAQSVLNLVKRYETMALQRNESASQNPTCGNVAGGLLNITLKSLGAIIKGGTTRIEGVIDYGAPIPGDGLYLMDGPGSDVISMSGLAASCATIMGFTTGRGTPQGHPFVPVVKIGTHAFPSENDTIDIDCGLMIEEKATLKDTADKLWEIMLNVANGQKTKAEINKMGQTLFWLDKTVSL